MSAPLHTPEDTDLTAAESKIAAIVVNYCGWRDTIACVESLLRSNRPLQWIIIVDNASPDYSLRRLQDWAAGVRPIEHERWPGIDSEPAPKPLPLTVLSEDAPPDLAKLQPGAQPHCILLSKNKNTGYAGGNNKGLKLGLSLDADAFWILNNDTLVHPDACGALLRRAFEHEKTGLVGCCVRYMQYPDIVQCCAGGYTNTWTLLSKMAGQALSLEQALDIPPEEVERGLNFIYGASFLVTREFIDAVGLMDERFFLYCEEQDWAFQAGDFALGYAPDAHVLHKEGAATGMRTQRYPLKRLLMITRSRLLLAAKHFPHHLPTVLCGAAYAAIWRIPLRKALAVKRSLLPGHVNYEENSTEDDTHTSGYVPSWQQEAALASMPPWRKFSIRAKFQIKKRLPRPLWNLLKICRNLAYIAGRQATHTITFNKKLSAYKRQILQLPAKNSPDFIAFRDSAAAISPACPRTIAFYLPQFHPFPENDLWWGKGFTEWTNVTKAVPQFIGHHQPRLPVDLGFYDLRLPEVMDQQIEMAKHYGVYGFCFHYYWFSGKRLMETPLFNFLENKELDMPFCLCWANESWSRRWDGSEDELLIEQKLRDEDDVLFMKDLQPFIADKRYITVENKPLLIIYRPHLWSRARVLRLLETFRKSAQEMGFPGLYIVCALTHDFQDNPEHWGFDAGVEFPPHMCGHVPHAKKPRVINPQFCGSIRDMRALVHINGFVPPSAYTTLKTVFPGWDNTARKLHQAFIFHHAEPEVYKDWLKNALSYTKDHNPPHAQYVFINAWNEWAEGAHLEPDRKYGYAFLQATAEALEEFAPVAEDDKVELLNSPTARPAENRF